MSPFPDVRLLPRTEDEWRIAVRAAAGLLLIDDARVFGLVAGGPDIDRDRCEEIIRLGGEQDITLRGMQAVDAAVAITAGWNGDEAELDE